MTLRRPRPWIAPLAILAVGAALRLPRLGAVPSPAHDEGNWLLAGWAAYQHRAVELPPDARFVTTLFASMIGAVWRVAGPDVATARWVPVTALLAGALAAWAVARRLGLSRAAPVLMASMVVHPWSVLWSRNVVTPYALSFALAVLAPMVLAAPPTRWRRVVGFQLLAWGFHFSPLAVLPCVAWGLWTLSDRARRATLATRDTALATLLAGLTVWPVMRGVLSVAARGTTRPSAYFDHLGTRLSVFLRTTLGGLTGTATVRDVAGLDLPVWCEWALVLAVVAWIVAARPRRDAPPSVARDLATLSWVHLLVALVGLPLLLGPVRQWHLPSVDAERYLFALLAPAVTLWSLGAWVRDARWCWVGPVLLLLGPTRAMGVYFARGGGPDRGVYTALGGGANRRWRPTRDARSVVRQILDVADTLSPDRRATVALADYVWFPIHFENARRAHTVIDLTTGRRPDDVAHPVLFVRWDDAVFVRGFEPSSMVRDNQRVAAEMRDVRYVDLHPVATLRQPDGTALVQLWAARLRGP